MRQNGRKRFRFFLNTNNFFRRNSMLFDIIHNSFMTEIPIDFYMIGTSVMKERFLIKWFSVGLKYGFQD